MARKPTQQRAIATYEKLLDAAGALLEELGVERISTNLVAERAGVSPPTLYNYFTDKYDLLAALGERLMEQQNALVVLDPAQDEAALAASLVEHVRVTLAYPGGPWVMRMLRAVPQLAEVRLASHRSVAAQLVEALLVRDPALDRAIAERRARLAVEFGYAAVELVFDEDGRDVDAIMRDTARAIRGLLDLRP
ncbi:TetR/AcrR family transcriptional regulator [Erythrobacter sp. SDW2]|uniref:TetR/AcrR family transcriptional regulator n=1 Tax=Erythrobacter sp. SDW2 TaxID=2907154 RepID=UPI001F443EE3|nr:TetR/AcrR family transcriptional regulator [Erythrobacter sp. SDW2]UIP07821.1 TetR/AcrR family transcriptional regulator [Erythrobacter sp. SDW2]